MLSHVDGAPKRNNKLNADLQHLTGTGRLAQLTETGMLDAPPEVAFDRITSLVQRLLGVEVALFSLVAETRQFFASAQGLTAPWAEKRETPLSHSFCRHVVTLQQDLVIEDARATELVRDNPAIRDLNVIAYLGVPVRTGTGHAIGSLCAISPSPRRWSEADITTMHELAEILETEIALRAKIREEQRAADHYSLLAREFDHRIKNTLAIAAGLVSLSARNSASMEQMTDDLRGRLGALAKAHDTAYADSNRVSLTDLTGLILSPYRDGATSIVISGEEIHISRRQITPLTLILYELTTNSTKHGALKNGGSIQVAVTSGEAGVDLAWNEASPILERSDADQQAGFGGELFQLAAAQVGGTIDLDWTDGRMTVRVSFAPEENGQGQTASIQSGPHADLPDGQPANVA